MKPEILPFLKHLEVRNFKILVRFFLYWAAATLKGLVEFLNMFLDHFSPSLLSQKWLFQELRF